ncbi:MAG: hypothetical protein KC777_03350 [Cyanobacteria bacterium HKST-UBA02]|nr:hypothetical protein [Cyanobacteria bacterium HKST-UBA02]
MKNRLEILATLTAIMIFLAAPAHGKRNWKPCSSPTCLRLKPSGWTYQNMPGKPDYLIWRNYPYQTAGGGGECWSLDHLGDSIAYVNGRPVDQGVCKTCHGRLYTGELGRAAPQAIPVHPQTYKKAHQTALGLPLVQLEINASPSQVYAWYLKQLPEHGWEVVDWTQVEGSYFLVASMDTRSKWMSFAPSSSGRCRQLVMNRRYN